MSFLAVFFVMLFWHALADFPLQGDFLSKAKNPVKPLPGIDNTLAMQYHCFIQAFGVWLITGNWFLASSEYVMHGIIDHLKCNDVISFRNDQYLHIACKVLWAYVAIVLPIEDFGLIHWMSQH
jgi:hypothetical protein